MVQEDTLIRHKTWSRFIGSGSSMIVNVENDFAQALGKYSSLCVTCILKWNCAIFLLICGLCVCFVMCFGRLWIYGKDVGKYTSMTWWKDIVTLDEKWKYLIKFEFAYWHFNQLINAVPNFLVIMGYSTITQY